MPGHVQLIMQKRALLQMIVMVFLFNHKLNTIFVS
jgi:hypothetical protein